MSTSLKLAACVAFAAAAFVAAPGAAQAQHYRHHHGHHYRGGGVTFGFGFGSPYAYYPSPYYGPACRWERVRYWRHGRWHWRSVRRCY